MLLNPCFCNRFKTLINRPFISKNVFNKFLELEYNCIIQKITSNRNISSFVPIFKEFSYVCSFKKSYFKHVNKYSIFSHPCIKFHPTIGFQIITLKRVFSLSCLCYNDETNGIFDREVDLVLKDTDFQEISNRLYRHPGTSHNLLVIQPRLKSGPNREKKEDSERKLDEAVALAHTLPNWKVKEKLIVPSTGLGAKLIFGSGNLENLKQFIVQDLSITAVFIGLNIMTALQVSTLENIFNVPVFDRYQIILQIFHDHAHTVEARLQLALAEIPYLRVKLAGYSFTKDSHNFIGIHHVGGDGETYMQKRRQILNDRELKLKKALEKVKNQRELLRHSQRREAHPLIAVVGYTNCGKTTLIKSLTNDERLTPEDKLFATLDVTLHLGLLPSSHKTLYIDTVGFISDVPTTLIQSFRSTLEEVTLADLVVHVRDISHPDTENQKKTVLKTLQELDLPQKLMNSILEVRNKADLLESIPEAECSDVFYVSATDGFGLPQLLEAMEQKLFENTGHQVVLLRIRNGGQEYSWLMREGGIRDSLVDAENPNFLVVEVALSPAKLGKFKHEFGDLSVSVEDIVL